MQSAWGCGHKMFSSKNRPNWTFRVLIVQGALMDFGRKYDVLRVCDEKGFGVGIFHGTVLTCEVKSWEYKDDEVTQGRLSGVCWMGWHKEIETAKLQVLDNQ